MLHTGDILGEYRVVGRIGAGGMGTVYIAQRTGAHGFARPVAIKVVDPRLAGRRGVLELFVREALLASRVDHPNVARVEQLFECDGRQLLVMEYVHGPSLAQLVRALAARGRRLAPELCVAIALQAADGLHAAHEARDERGELLDLVHRDVSPQNVLVSRGGHVKLIDFGVAKAAAVPHDRTQTGALRGKVRYMAPEQAYGDAVDRRADVYALGVVLWELLTMRAAFQAENDFKLLDLVRQPALLPPSEFAPDVPRAVDLAVMAALAPGRAERLPTANALRQRLAEAMPAALGVDPATLGALVSALVADDGCTIDDAALREQLETPPTRAPEAERLLAELTRATTATPALDARDETAAADEHVAAVARGKRSRPARAPRRGAMAAALALVVAAVTGAAFVATATHGPAARAPAAAIRLAPAAADASLAPEAGVTAPLALARAAPVPPTPSAALAHDDARPRRAPTAGRARGHHAGRASRESSGRASTGGLPFARAPGF